jgi:hypothetical protein
MNHEESDVVWVVVLVISGVPDSVEVYRDQKSALAREKAWRKDLRPDYDEVGVFEVEIGVQSPD